jgi:hypothetical protein
LDRGFCVAAFDDRDEAAARLYRGAAFLVGALKFAVWESDVHEPTVEDCLEKPLFPAPQLAVLPAAPVPQLADEARGIPAGPADVPQLLCPWSMDCAVSRTRSVAAIRAVLQCPRTVRERARRLVLEESSTSHPIFDVLPLKNGSGVDVVFMQSTCCFRERIC